MEPKGGMSMDTFNPIDMGKRLLTLFFGAADGLLYALIVVIILDYVTGVCVAVHSGKLSSTIGAKGIAKKVGIFALISVSHIIDTYLLKSSDAIRTVTTTFYISNEFLSILENATKLNLPLPEKLRAVLTSLYKEK